MPGRKQDRIWMYFDKDVEIGKSGCKAKCKECGKSMQGIVARMKQHHSECKTDTQDTPAITVSTPRKRPAPEAGESSPLCTPTKRTKISAGSGMNVPLWDFQGNTIVTNNYIRLTSDSQSKQGAIWNSIPVYVRNWELHVHFKVHGHGKDLFGDGIAIWYTRDRLQPGQVFGNKDYFMGLAIFLDTYSNHNGPHNHAHPWVSAMVNNGSLHYDHDRDGTHTMVSGAGCESQFRNKDHETYIAIRYSNNILKVSMDIDGKNIWKECFIVMGVRLPTGYFFGVSAATGELADNHDVISLKLYELDSPDDPDDDTDYARIIPSAEEIVAPRDRVDDVKGSYVLGQMSGWKLLLIIILIIIGVCVCAVVGYIVFQRQQESSRKRFY